GMTGAPQSSAQKVGGRDLTQGPIASTLLWFTLPALGSTALQSLNASVNAAWIGHYLGEAALSATSNANLLLFFLLGIVFGVSIANSVLVGQAVGARRLHEVKRIVGTSLSFFGLASVVMAIVGALETPTILALMKTPPEAQPLAAAYLRVIFMALPFMYLYNFLMMAMRGAGDSKTPFRFTLLSVGLDIALNPILILGLGPLPAMGIAGSATATLIAQTTSLVAMVITLQRRRPLGPRGRDHANRCGLQLRDDRPAGGRAAVVRPRVARHLPARRVGRRRHRPPHQRGGRLVVRAVRHHDRPVRHHPRHGQRAAAAADPPRRAVGRAPAVRPGARAPLRHRCDLVELPGRLRGVAHAGRRLLPLRALARPAARRPRAGGRRRGDRRRDARRPGGRAVAGEHHRPSRSPRGALPDPL